VAFPARWLDDALVVDGVAEVGHQQNDGATRERMKATGHVLLLS
jgi:hypothetical protein